MKTIFIKPAPGRLIRDPDTMRPLAQEGEEKPFTPFWCRRLDDGDVIQAEKAAEEAPLYLRMQRLRQKNRSPNRHPIRRNRND